MTGPEVQPGGPFPPPGWHPDPTGRHEQRYWDGTRWSDHVADRGQVGVDPLHAPPPTSAPTPVPGDAPPSVPATGGGLVAPSTFPGMPGGAATGAPPGAVRGIGGLAASLTVVLWIAAAVGAFAVFAFANRAVVADDLLQGELVTFERADDADEYAGLALLGLALVSLAVLVLLIVWMWRVAKNAELAGRARPRFGAGWTIGGWFVPLANVVIPVLVVQDLWRASDPTVPPGDPAWRRARGSALVGWWWATHLLASLRWFGGSDAESFDDLDAVRALDATASVSALVSIAAAFLLMAVVRQVTRRQEALLAGLALAPGPVTPA